MTLKKGTGELGRMSHLEQFHYKLTGPEQGRTWVFLHGLMGYSNNWASVIRAIDSTERCLVYDQRGHGQSFKPRQGYSSEDYANDLKNIIDELGFKKIILVGHSMGGRNALCFASAYPERVDKLIIEDIGPEGDPNNYLYYENMLGSIPTPFAGRKQAQEFFERQFSQVFRVKEDPKVLAGFLIANLKENEVGLLDWRFSSKAMIESVRQGRSKDSWELVKKLNVPTLWIRGENSTELSSETFQRILSTNPIIQGVIIPKAGHWVHSENKEGFVAAMKSFTGFDIKQGAQ